MLRTIESSSGCTIMVGAVATTRPRARTTLSTGTMEASAMAVTIRRAIACSAIREDRGTGSAISSAVSDW